MKELVSYIISQIADHPEKVEIREHKTDKRIELLIHVDREDRGKVIGKNGRVIRAVRTVVSAAEAKQGRHVIVELAE